jgi:hypothetical protein
MTAAMSWPAAAIVIAAIVSFAVVLSVAAWQIFATGRTAISAERR